MKNPIRFLSALLAIAFCVLCSSLLAQAAVDVSNVLVADSALSSQHSTLDSEIAAPATLSWQQAAIAIITPLIIAGVKMLVPRIPRAWLPVIAPVVGCALDVIAHFATGSALNPTVALVLGAAGVGLREVVDQVKQAGGRVITDPPAQIS